MKFFSGLYGDPLIVGQEILIMIISHERPEKIDLRKCVYLTLCLYDTMDQKYL
jgi:hypothetical protein